MIFDIILVVIFLLLIIVNARRGAARALAGIINAVISYFAATALGKILSVGLYNWLVRPSIDNAAAQAVNNIGANAASAFSNALPGWLKGVLSISDENLYAVLTDSLGGSAEAVSRSVNDAVQPIAVSVIAFFVTLILFILLYLFIGKLVINPILRLFELPVIRGINRFLGALIGLVDAFLVVSMMAYLLRLLLANINFQSSWLNESTIYNSFIFYHFYSGNIFTALCSWIGI